ncbi:MAG TPA: FadR/GntR family transcriptional regulator, partial [Negativicutes bacterium]|nr:FadR/GntR family transcriptional regulator [Negativicutes bacterium]
ATVDTLRVFIDKGELSPGDKLPSERELQEQFGVSRSILREALRVVESQGLISIIQGKGAYVRKPGLRTVIEPVQRLINDGSITLGDLMRARHVLEPEIARIACGNINDSQLEMLEQDFQEMNKYLEFPEKYLECDKNFHSRLAVSTGNPVLVIMAWPLINLFQGFIPLFYERPGTPRKVVSAHDKVLTAIRERDPEGAANAMRGHLTEVTEWFGNLIDEKIINNE